MKFSATTVTDKLRALRQAIEYVEYLQCDEGCSQTSTKCKEVKERLKRWGKGLTKDIRKQRNKNSVKSSYDVCIYFIILTQFHVLLTQVKTADSPQDFISSPAVAMKVKEVMETAKGRPLIWQEISVVLAYLAANIIFLNGQRPGVVQRMTIKEWELRVEEIEDEWVIEVMDHKTTGAFGPARVAVSKKIAQLMQDYFINIRQKITPQNSTYAQRFFLTNTGNEFNKVSERMKDVAKSFGLTVPNPGLQRKVVATEVFKSKDNIMVRNIQKHMCHSATTCEKFYQHTDKKLAVSSMKAIEELTLSRYFTPSESNAILKEYPLTEDGTPSLAICEQICQKYQLKKTKKQVQDHWRTCKKSHKEHIS